MHTHEYMVILVDPNRSTELAVFGHSPGDVERAARDFLAEHAARKVELYRRHDGDGFFELWDGQA